MKQQNEPQPQLTNNSWEWWGRIKTPPPRRNIRRIVIGILLMIIAIIAAVVGWYTYFPQ